jgi:steroid 5-alpha reductase family enzyme
VTLLDPGLSGSKPGYAEYVETTNAFIPGPERR